MILNKTSTLQGVYSVPVGCDFANSFAKGLLDRFATSPPETLARTEIYVNSRRMERRLHDVFLQSNALLLPQVHLITDIANRPNLPIDLPQPVSALRRRLQLARLVKALLAQEPDLAPQSAVFDFAASLGNLLDEMQGEGVPFDRLEKIRIGELSGHWERSLTFLRILSDHWNPDEAVDPQDRQRAVALALADHWKNTPPDHPVIIAGSTGSRGASAEFMRAVAHLPQGAVVLPGFDSEMPAEAWEKFDDPRVSMDHPQSAVYRFCSSLDLDMATLAQWEKTAPAHPARNRLVSLALRPAPFTDQWLAEGPALAAEIPQATANITLLESETPKDEARTLALRLRQAAGEGQKSVLISPDRALTRRVSAALKRWNILADDSAGSPLHQSPPGILLRLLGNCFGQHLTPLMLTSLLKHPLTARGDETGKNRLFARNLELKELRGGAPFVDFNRLEHWAAKADDPALTLWVGWLRDMLEPLRHMTQAPLAEWVMLHKQLAEKMAAGPGQSGSGELWEKEAGKQAALTFAKLEQEAEAAGDLSVSDYTTLFLQVLQEGEVREALTPHPLIAIMGPREAREQGAELVILAGLNEGIWPKPETPDPWLNRSMRQQIGLPPPERQIGLSAHDFQQAIAAPEVILSRALRDGEAPTVASRWVLRLSNLLGGLEQGDTTSLKKMRTRGLRLTEWAQTLDLPAIDTPRATRPAPCPPVDARPKRLSVTRIKTLVRDPYAIYASSILRLRPLFPLGKEPNAMERGNVLHEVLERFITETLDNLSGITQEKFLETAAIVLEKEAPWPAARRFWLARLARISEWFVATETDRRKRADVLAQERSGERRIPELDFLLTAKADRIDITPSGTLWIYDYKSGKPPTPAMSKTFDKQLQLEAAIAQAGGFDDVKPAPVAGLEYIGLGATAAANSGIIQPVPIDDEIITAIWDELTLLIRAYQKPQQGYSARARMQKSQDISDYDHLSRRGEWEDSDTPKPEQVG
jgi:double-strand break repair protein AddB